VPSPSEDVWGVLKTTSIQAGEFQPEHNKLLPSTLEPRPLIEVKEGDILITCAGPRVRCGVSCLVRQTRKRLMMSGKMYRFRVDADRTDAGYVEAFLQTERARLAIDNMKTGSSDSGLNLTHDRFRQLSIPVAPLPEQRRIVAEIEKQFTRLEAGGAALRRVQANLKRYRAAVLKAACEGRLVPTEAALAKTGNGKSKFETGEALLVRILTERRQNWQGRGKYKEPASPETTNLPPLPGGWTWATSDQLTRVITDGEHITPERSETGILLLSARNVLDGGISLEDVDYVPPREYDRIAKRLVIAPGDVLLSCSGSVGRSAVVPEGLLFTLVRSVAVLKPLARMGKYLCIALRSPLLKQQITAKQTQTAQANIFQGKIKVLCVPLPPLAEQTRIVAEVERRLSVVEELEAVVSANLQRATRLQQAVLHRAFEGRLVEPAPSAA
jgi:type I restriction enzyme S subunit